MKTGDCRRESPGWAKEILGAGLPAGYACVAMHEWFSLLANRGARHSIDGVPVQGDDVVCSGEALN